MNSQAGPAAHAAHTPARTLSRCARLLACAGALLMPALAHAEVLQAPAGGRSIPLGDGRVACGAAADGWSVEASGHAVRPPRDESAVGHAVELKVAPSTAACEAQSTPVTLLATGPLPAIDIASVVFSPDDGRLDAKGQHLLGVSVAWKSGHDEGVDTCRDPENDHGTERCAWIVGHASADPTATIFSFIPPGGRAGPDVSTFDAAGTPVPPGELALPPARVLLTRLLPDDATVDLATGQGQIPLLHPEAVTSADCGALQCSMVDGKLMVRGAAQLVSSLEAKLRLLPHVFLQGHGGPEPQPVVKLAVLHCPMTIVSGPPIRNNDDAKVIVKLQGGCARQVSALRFTLGSTTLPVLQTVSKETAAYALLRLGSIGDGAITITAVRGEAEGIALAVAHTPTRNVPAVRAALELPGYPNLDFIPTNRPALVHVSSAGEHERFWLLPIEGVYGVHYDRHGNASIRGEPNAAGLTMLRFGVRADDLPGGLDQIDLAVTSDPLQRPIRQANLPAPISVSVHGKAPLIEVRCGAGKQSVQIVPGETAHIPFELRDTCRVVFHRERLLPEYGTQKIHFEIDVLRADGSARGDAHVSEVVSFRTGSGPRYAWIHGVADPFDRVVVRVSHEADEAHYVGASEIRTGAPAAQWSAILGTGHLRLYGTTTIPTGLYRISDKAHSGVLSLNFGVISRLTWLDSEGHEGFIGLEGGVLVMGLANSLSNTGESLTQVGAVFGLGLGVPIVNRNAAGQASINLHAWLETDITHGTGMGGRTAIIFGPSITIGNVGMDL